MTKLETIEKRLNSTLGGTWHTEENEHCWQLFAENKIQVPKAVIATMPDQYKSGYKQINNIDENDMQLLHPYQIIKALKPAAKGPMMEYWPNEADNEFLNNVKQDMRYLIDQVKQLEEITSAYISL